MGAQDEPQAISPRIYNQRLRLRAPLGEAAEYALGSLITHRWQIIQTFRRDFTGLSDLTRWGAFWNYALPIVPLGVYVLLMALRLFPSFGEVSGVVYITMGVTLWFLFSGLLRSPVAAIERDFKSLARTDTPIFVAIATSVSTLFFETMVRAIVVIAVFIAFQGAPSWKIVYAPAFLVFGALLFASIGVILALFNLAYRDIAKILGVTLAYGIFFSGVIFPLQGGAVMDAILRANPFFVFIENIRSACVGGGIVYPSSLATFCALSVALSAIAVIFAYRSEFRLRGLV